MSHLGKRLVSSAFLVSIAVFTIFWGPLWFFIIVTEALVLLSLHEYLSLAERKQIPVNRVLCMISGALMPVAVYYHADMLLLVLSCLAIFSSNFRRAMLHHGLIGTAVAMFGIVYVAWFLSHLVALRMVPHGAPWVFYVALIVKGGDAGAYFAGTRWGKAKLLEHVSPKKSMEGAVAGLLTSVILSLIAKSFLPHVSFGHLLLLGAMVGAISQIGDLGESLIKRDAGVKDSGTIPGLGGILDVMDSLLLTIPFVYHYIVFFLGSS